MLPNLNETDGPIEIETQQTVANVPSKCVVSDIVYRKVPLQITSRCAQCVANIHQKQLLHGPCNPMVLHSYADEHCNRINTVNWSTAIPDDRNAHFSMLYYLNAADLERASFGQR